MIYFIKAGRFVKIGYSKNPRSRLKELQTSNPERLKIIATMPGCYKTEAGLHVAFSRFRKNGEWFRYEGFLKTCLMAINDNGNTIEIVDVRTLQKAGTHLQVRQKRNRNKNFRDKLKKRNLS